MTPPPMNAPPVQPAALPLVALILGVVGFCVPPLFLIAIVLAIVSLAKASEPAYAARKVLAIITLVLGLVYVPVVGILAAVAIPSFVKYTARAKQSECKTNLKAAYTAQKVYFAEHDEYGDTAEEIGFAPMGNNRYLYRLGPESVIAAGQSTMSSEQLEAGFPAGLEAKLGAFGACPDDCDVTMACAGNIDNDDTIDVWTISTAQRTVKGELVPPGIPFNDRDDLRE